MSFTRLRAELVGRGRACGRGWAGSAGGTIPAVDRSALWEGAIATRDHEPCTILAAGDLLTRNLRIH
jgi:hypothetical protein